MGTVEHTAQLFDMHCHLGFVSDPETARVAVRESDVRALSCTVTPTEYEHDRETFADMAACTVALGLHPWQVADGTCQGPELARFEHLARTTRFIGEVGLDFTKERDGKESRQLQQGVFEHVLTACDAPSPHPRKLISIHVSNAAAEALDLLDKHATPARHDCIFHWFQGSSDQLKRAVEMGCYFSIGPRMLDTKRGREYARIIPVDRLLLETDSPAHPGDEWGRETWIDSLTSALKAIAKIRATPEDELARTIAHTSENLLGPIP